MSVGTLYMALILHKTVYQNVTLCTSIMTCSIKTSRPIKTSCPARTPLHPEAISHNSSSSVSCPFESHSYHYLSREGYDVGRLLVRSVMCTEPANISFLWFLWYIAQGGGVCRITSTTNGAQVCQHINKISQQNLNK